jgi:sugar O-acyltransferase (sialic acid O-acetyltransferase NeuD family)
MAKIILFGLTPMSEVMLSSLSQDSVHQAVAFTVDGKYVTEDSFCGLPVIPFETIERTHPPDEYEMLICLGFRDANRLRANKFAEAKAKGYKLVTYISPRASVRPGVVLGENCFVDDFAVLMPFSRIGNDVFINGGCFIGHHSIVDDHCFLAAHAIVLGCSRIGTYSILGPNSTVKDLVSVADSCIIGTGVQITKDTKSGQVYVADPPRLLKKSADNLRTWVTWSSGLHKNRGSE